MPGQGDPSLWKAATEQGLVGVAKHFGWHEPAFTVNEQGNDVIKTFFDDQAAAIPEADQRPTGLRQIAPN
jgi:hypothetical protein